MNSTYRDDTITDAQPDTPCGWKFGDFLTCQSGMPAVHVLKKDLPVAPKGTALCSYHSPFEVK